MSVRRPMVGTSRATLPLPM
ncbi:hypothetical protein AB0M04_25580 [Nocardia xishanensis]